MRSAPENNSILVLLSTSSKSVAHLVGHVVHLSDGADDAGREIRGGDVLDRVSDHFAKNVAHPVDVVADSGNQPGNEHQVFPIWLLVTRDAHHITIAAAVALKSKCESKSEFIIGKLD
jgi:hypothetical protein